MENLHERGWQGFCELCAKIESPETLKAIFDLFFTIEEKETFAARYLIIKALLDSNLPQREIAHQLKVSIAQITRGSNALKIIPPKLKEMIKSMQEPLS